LGVGALVDVVSVVEFDGDGAFGDVGGDHDVGVHAARARCCPAVMGCPPAGVGGSALDGDGFGAGPGWWPGGAGSAQFAGVDLRSTSGECGNFPFQLTMK
jgi:hypothetical protein